MVDILEMSNPTNQSLQSSGKPDAACEQCHGSGWLNFAEKYQLRRDDNGRPMRDERGNPIRDVVESIQIGDIPNMEFDRDYPGFTRVLNVCPCLYQSRKVAQQETQYNTVMQQIQLTTGRPDLPDYVYSHTLADFEIYPEALDAARQMIEGFVTIDGRTKPGVLYIGNPGTGKSTLGGLVVLSRQDRGDTVMVIKYLKLMGIITSTFKKDMPLDSLDIIQTIANVDFLMLDDIGAISANEASPYRNEVFDQIIDMRDLRKKPTLITTNLNPIRLWNFFDPRIMSRITGMCHAIEMDNGIDFRTGKPHQKRTK